MGSEINNQRAKKSPLLEIFLFLSKKPYYLNYSEITKLLRNERIRAKLYLSI